MKKIAFSLVLCMACFCSYAQDSMNKKMENKTDKMNKKMDNTTDRMNKKLDNAPDTPKDKQADSTPIKPAMKSKKKKIV